MTAFIHSSCQGLLAGSEIYGKILFFPARANASTDYVAQLSRPLSRSLNSPTRLSKGILFRAHSTLWARNNNAHRYPQESRFRKRRRKHGVGRGRARRGGSGGEESRIRRKHSARDSFLSDREGYLFLAEGPIRKSLTSLLFALSPAFPKCMAAESCYLPSSPLIFPFQTSDKRMSRKMEADYRTTGI